MNTIERTTGNAYTSDPDYSDFLGKQYESVIYDWSYRCLVRCVMQAPKTKSDSVISHDPDLVIADEGIDPDGNARRGRNLHAKSREIIDSIRKELQEQPLSTRQLAKRIGCDQQKMTNLLLNHLDGFVILGRTKEGNVYGLPGIQYSTRVYYQGMERIMGFLKKFGPSPIGVICRELKTNEQHFHKAVKTNPGVLTIVGHTKDSRGRNMRLWGVVGVHGSQGAST